MLRAEQNICIIWYSTVREVWNIKKPIKKTTLFIHFWFIVAKELLQSGLMMKLFSVTHWPWHINFASPKSHWSVHQLITSLLHYIASNMRLCHFQSNSDNYKENVIPTLPDLFRDQPCCSKTVKSPCFSLWKLHSDPCVLGSMQSIENTSWCSCK